MRITKGKKYRSLAVSMTCMIVLGTLFSFISILPYVKLQYLAYLFSVIHRAFTYGGNAAVIAMCFPIQYFGKLYGISQVSFVEDWFSYITKRAKSQSVLTILSVRNSRFWLANGRCIQICVQYKLQNIELVFNGASTRLPMACCRTRLLCKIWC